MPFVRVRRGKMLEEVIGFRQSGEDRQINFGAQPDQGVNRFEFPMEGGWMERAVGVRTVGAQGFDQRYLYLAFAWDSACGNQYQRFVADSGIRACLEEGLRHVHNIRGHGAVPDRIFRDEFKQAGIAKVVCALEKNAPVNEMGVLREMGAQGCDIARIDEVHRMAKGRVLNPLVVWESEAVNQRGLFNVTFEPGPTYEAALARDRQLRITEAERLCENLLVCCTTEFWMKFSKPLRAAKFFRRVLLQKVFRLVLEVVEVRVCGKTFDWHENFLSFARGPHGTG
jgi:hypothetical protein